MQFNNVCVKIIGQAILIHSITQDEIMKLIIKLYLQIMAHNCRKQKCNTVPNAKRTRDSFNFFSVLLYDLKFLFKRINDLIKLHYQLQTWNFHSQQLDTPTFCDIQEVSGVF